MCHLSYNFIRKKKWATKPHPRSSSKKNGRGSRSPVDLLHFTCPLNILCFFFDICHSHFNDQEQSRKQGYHNYSNVLQTLLYRHKYLFHPFFSFSSFFFQKKRFSFEIIHHLASLGQTNSRRIHLLATQQ